HREPGHREQAHREQASPPAMAPGNALNPDASSSTTPMAASHPSEDTLALAAAVAASIPAAPLARPLPERRSSTTNMVAMSQGQTTENRLDARGRANAAAPEQQHRRSLFQRLFGWAS
ncbi:hypothetical protein KR018_004854, partial [Drosophila ironensis]